MTGKPVLLEKDRSDLLPMITQTAPGVRGKFNDFLTVLLAMAEQALACASDPAARRHIEALIAHLESPPDLSPTARQAEAALLSLRAARAAKA